MKNKLWVILIVLIGMVDLGYGIHQLYQNYHFRKNAGLVQANIYGVSHRKDGKKVLYIDFLVEGQKYDGVVVTTKKDIEKKDTIQIYYDLKNPKKFTDGTFEHSSFFFVGIGLFSVLLGITYLLIKK